MIARLIAGHPETGLTAIARLAHRSLHVVWQIYRAELAAGRTRLRTPGGPNHHR
jgi:hypothetical protein